MNKKLLALLMAFVCIFIWGITFICTKVLLVDFSPLEILFVRFLCAYLCLWIIRPKWEKIAFKDNLWYLLAGLSGIVVYQFAENTAINFTTATNVSVIVSICPMFTAIICQIFLKEKNINRFFIIGFVIAILGVSLVSLNGKLELSVNPIGDMLAFVSSISWGFYTMFVSIINRKNYDLICSTRRIFFFAVIFMIPLMIIGMFVGPENTMYVNLDKQINAARFASFKNWINLLFLGVAASSLCFSMWSKVCNELGSVKTSLGLYMIPVVTLVFAFIVLKEKITWMGFAGLVLTITGLFVSSIRKNNKP